MRRAARTSPRASNAAQLARELKERPAPPKEDPAEMLTMTPRELEASRETAVGQAFGITGADVSRDGTRAVYRLGGAK